MLAAWQHEIAGFIKLSASMSVRHTQMYGKAYWQLEGPSRKKYKMFPNGQ